MKRIILAPDSFKGTLSAREVCRVEARAIRRLCPGAEVVELPMADGGEGLVDACCRLTGGTQTTVRVSGPLGDTVEACYGLLPDGGAVVEMAAAAGLPLVQGREDPLNATTRGVGELLLDAAGRGARSILLGLGGSCTNDCGIGMAAALGFRFLDGAGTEVEPLAKNLGRIAEILPPAENRLPPIRAACDVTNPLLGPRGATYTFGPQKGADGPALEALEEGMTSFARVLARYAGVEDVQIPGAGAAGGLGAAVIFLLGGTLTPGAELLLDQAGFDGLLEGADLVITGEGRMDGQSAAGKVPGAVAARCRRAGVPCLALCGSVGDGAEILYGQGITAIFSAVRGAADFAAIQRRAGKDLEFLTEAAIRLFLAGGGRHV